MDKKKYDKRTTRTQRRPESGNTHRITQKDTTKYHKFVQVPDWMTKRKTTLIQKDPSKGTVPNNYRPINCLPMMEKIFKAQIREDIYYSLKSRGLFREEQK